MRRLVRNAAPLAPLAIAAFAIAFAGGTPSCTRTQDITFVLRVPVESKAAATWVEIAAYDSPACPSITQLSGGLPRGGVVQRLGFANGSPAPTFRLHKGTYAFSATVRNDQCEVLAAGCTDIAVPGGSEITINLKESAIKGGKCAGGSACLNAECVPALGGNGTGTGCTLEVMGAGPLEALNADGSNVSRPGITAVNDGFVIAYSQIDGTKYRVTTMKIGYDGGPVRADDTTSLPYNRYEIPGACEDDAKTEGLGLLFNRPNEVTGLLVVPRSPKCTRASTAMSIFKVGQDAHLANEPPASPSFQAGADSHVMSNRPLGVGGYVTSVVNGQAQLQTFNGTAFTAAGRLVGGAPPHARSWVAGSQKAVAVLTQTAGEGGPLLDDGGGGGDAPELRLEVAYPPAPLSPAPLLHGRFASMAMQDQRVVVVSSGSLQAPVEMHLLNIGEQAFLNQSVPPDEQGDTLAADVAIAGNRLFIASMQAYGVSVLAFDDFAGTPKLLKAKPLGRDFRVKQFMGGIFDTLRDGFIAIAANQPYVGVVWMTGRRVAAGEEVGGWAVLACR